jgi:RND family efflux transporter MFP subunit
VLVEPTDFQFHVKAQGTVVPRRESDLVPQVSGEVVWVSPDLVAGGFVDAGQLLLRIDPADYEAALESARANVARAESEFARAKKERGRQGRLADRSVASEARIDDAENAYRVAQASLRERRAQLSRAERDLARTELASPYEGRVRSEQVDEGQFASRGVALARLYAVDYAEVRLPVPDRELAYLDLVLARRTRDDDAPNSERAELGPSVELRAEFAGREHSWSGRIVRTEGELDPKSRMVRLVVRVEDPYGSTTADRPPLAVGLFVTADIEGLTVQDAYVLPRAALRRERGEQRTHVLVVDADSRLRFRDVTVLRTERGRAIVGSGLQPGERVCISPLRAVTDGMRVRIVDDPPPDPELLGAAS